MNKNHNMLGLFILLFLAFRLLLVFSVREIGNIEILHIGTIAKDLIEGLVMPLWDYQFSSYDGGTLLVGILTVPFFVLFGYTAFSLSLAAVVFSAGTFVLWYLFLIEHFNKRVAWIFSVLFIIPPYLFSRHSIVLSANHMQGGIFAAWFFLVFYRILFNKTGVTRRRDVFLLGLISGLGTWFCYSFLVILFVSFLFWYLLRPKKLSPAYLVFLGGGVLGYSPGFFRLAVFAPLLKNEIFDQILSHGFGKFWWKLKGLLQIRLSGMPPVFLNGYWLGFSILFVLLVWKNRYFIKELAGAILPFSQKVVKMEFKELPILLFPVVYLVIYGFSSFDIIPGDTNYLHYRYLLPIFPFIFIIIAVTIDYLLAYNKKNLMGIGCVLFVFFSLLGIGDTALNLRDKSFPNYSHLKSRGFSYEMLGSVVCWRFKDEPSKAIELIGLVEKEYRPDAYRGFAFELAIIDKDVSIKRYTSLISDTRDRDSFVTGFVLGSGFNYFEGTGLGESYPAVLKSFDSNESIMYFYDTADLINGLADGYKPTCYMGLGMQFAALYHSAVNVPQELGRKIPPEYQFNFLEGVNLGVRRKRI